MKEKRRLLTTDEHIGRTPLMSKDTLDDLMDTRTFAPGEDIELFESKPRPVRSINGKFQPYMIDEVFHLAQYGMTNNDICAWYGITQATFGKYLRLYPEFDRKLHEGRELNGMKLVQNLYRQAMGYVVEDSVKEYGYRTDPETGVRTKYLKKKTIEKKHIQGNTKVAMWLLKCRFPLLWNTTSDSIKMKNPNISITQNNFDLSQYTMEELELMKKIGLTQSEGNNPTPYIQD